MESVGKMLKEYRNKKSYSAADVAYHIGLNNPQFIYNIEQGQRPIPWDKINAIANFLEIPIKEFCLINLKAGNQYKLYHRALQKGMKEGVV
jgi:transcriptional regulator with XRE-family HTH domain